ncbi:MAG: VanZ family protein, partial [Tuberibacillus sp.]
LHYNIIPFKTILYYFLNPEGLHFMIIYDNLIGNLLVFMPLGFIVAFYFIKMRRIGRILIMSLCSTFMVEITQLLTNLGTFDIDDMILNTLGGLMGYICFLIAIKAFSLFFAWDHLKLERNIHG